MYIYCIILLVWIYVEVYTKISVRLQELLARFSPHTKLDEGYCIYTPPTTQKEPHKGRDGGRPRAARAKQRAKGTWPRHKHAPHHTHTTTTQKHHIYTYNLYQHLQHPLWPSTPKPCLQIIPAASTNIFTPLLKTSTWTATIRRIYRSFVAPNVPALPPAAPWMMGGPPLPATSAHMVILELVSLSL